MHSSANDDRIPRRPSHRCDKVRYHDKEQAQSAVRRLAGSTRFKKPTRAYYCSKCQGWHLTSRAFGVFGTDNA